MDVGACTSDIYPDEERTPSDLLRSKHRKKCSSCALRPPHPPFPSLRFSIWIKWGVHVGRQRRGQGCWEIACSRRDILHLPIQSVVFSNFEMKGKNAERIAAECIAVDWEAQEPQVRSWWGILHTGLFFLSRPQFLLLLLLKIPSDSLFEPAVIDGRRVLDRAGRGWPRAKCGGYPIVSQR